MATITVTGTVTGVFFENKGARISEYFPKKDGGTGENKFTAWFETPQPLVVGEAVTVTGLHSAKIEDWTDRDGNPKMDNSGKQGRSVVVSINNASYKSESPDFNATVTAATPAAGEDAPF